MADFIVHNTLTGKKESLNPIKKGTISLYVCGITPYDEVHLGHARCYVVFDVLKRALKINKFKVKHIQNFTDVDDKIIERANKVKEDPIAYAEKFIASYHRWMKLLHVDPADKYPKVTDNMRIIVKLIKKLVDKGMAYVEGGNVFYSIRKFKNYGALSNRKIDELEAGARVDVNEKKKDPLDFALWKESKPGEPAWDSPWGKGRPGWHIECSAMSTHCLGDTFDIHGGGQDLIFPHHENEIAQSNGATGNSKGFAKVWIHNGFVTINKEKMSKSLGNFFTIKDILNQYDPVVVRYFLLSQHYRSPLNFSDADLKAARTTWNQRVKGAFDKLNLFLETGPGSKDPNPIMKKDMDALVDSFHAALRSDLNTPGALGFLNQFCYHIFQMDEVQGGQIKKAFWKSVKKNFVEMLNTLGLETPKKDQWDSVILELVQKREQARKHKDWKLADQIRDQLLKKKVVVEDSPQGPRIKPLT